MGPRAGLDGCGKCRLHRDSIPGPSSPLRVAIPTELSLSPTFRGYSTIISSQESQLLTSHTCDNEVTGIREQHGLWKSMNSARKGYRQLRAGSNRSMDKTV